MKHSHRSWLTDVVTVVVIVGSCVLYSIEQRASVHQFMPPLTCITLAVEYGVLLVGTPGISRRNQLLLTLFTMGQLLANCSAMINISRCVCTSHVDTNVRDENHQRTSIINHHHHPEAYFGHTMATMGVGMCALWLHLAMGESTSTTPHRLD